MKLIRLKVAFVAICIALAGVTLAVVYRAKIDGGSLEWVAVHAPKESDPRAVALLRSTYAAYHGLSSYSCEEAISGFRDVVGADIQYRRPGSFAIRVGNRGPADASMLAYSGYTYTRSGPSREYYRSPNPPGSSLFSVELAPTTPASSSDLILGWLQYGEASIGTPRPRRVFFLGPPTLIDGNLCDGVCIVDRIGRVLEYDISRQDHLLRRLRSYMPSLGRQPASYATILYSHTRINPLIHDRIMMLPSDAVVRNAFISEGPAEDSQVQQMAKAKDPMEMQAADYVFAMSTTYSAKKTGHMTDRDLITLLAILSKPTKLPINRNADILHCLLDIGAPAFTPAQRNRILTAVTPLIAVNKNGITRFMAAAVIGEMGEKQTISLLIPLLKDSEVGVRCQATISLDELGYFE